MTSINQIRVLYTLLAKKFQRKKKLSQIPRKDNLIKNSKKKKKNQNKKIIMCSKQICMPTGNLYEN